MSVAEMLSHAAEVRRRLRNPANAVEDDGIDLKRPPRPKLASEPEPEAQPDPEMEHAPGRPNAVIIPIRTPFMDMQEQIEKLERIVYGSAADDDPPLWVTHFSIGDIQKAVCDHYRIAFVDLVSARRTYAVVRPRQVAMYLAKVLTLRSLPAIGRRFGNRDHTTVLHAVRKIADLRERDLVLNQDIETIGASLGARPSQYLLRCVSRRPAGAQPCDSPSIVTSQNSTESLDPSLPSTRLSGT